METHAEALALHRELLKLRAEDPVISQQDATKLEGAVLSAQAFVLRWQDSQHGDRLLVVNLDRELELRSPAEPLLSPPHGARWSLLWSSEHPRYGGHGTALPVAEGGRGPWRLTAQSAVLLSAHADPT
jgi:maltooligosyltrehalose trehalohydrolase